MKCPLCHNEATKTETGWKCDRLHEVGSVLAIQSRKNVQPEIAWDPERKKLGWKIQWS